VAETDYAVPFGSASISRAGDDLSVIALGRMVSFAMQAVEQLARGSISIEIIDPRTIVPMDWDTKFASVEKTNRALVVEEASGFCSVGAEIVATISECHFMSLDGPVRRLSAPHLPKPFTPPLENLSIPSVDDIVDYARRGMSREA